MGGTFGTDLDRADIASVCNGDMEAFQGLVERHAPLVERIVSRHVPGDRIKEVAQDAFVRACFSLGSFKGNKPFAHWLSVLSVRACHDFWRREYAVRERPLAELSENAQAWLDRATAAEAQELFEQETAQREALAVLDWALGRLGPLDRMVLALTSFEGHSVAEAAALLGLSTVNVKVRAYRSRKKIKRLIEEQMGERP
ncbi:MAG: sigma-70 family RNA polymerase sigma factor [Desulfovibrionaceae bacterium]